MEQPGSDQENLDSEASQSSESLLDELQRSSVHCSDPEGKCSRFRLAPPPSTCFSHSPVGFWPDHGAAGLGPSCLLWYRSGPVMVMGGDVCSITKQVGGTATVFVCLCLCDCVHTSAHPCMHVHACVAPKHAQTFIRFNLLEIWHRMSKQMWV